MDCIHTTHRRIERPNNQVWRYSIYGDACTFKGICYRQIMNMLNMCKIMITFIHLKINPCTNGSPVLHLKQLMLACNEDFILHVVSTLKSHSLQHSCIQYEELCEVYLWFYASIPKKHYCLETDVKGSKKIAVFTAPQIITPRPVWLKRTKGISNKPTLYWSRFTGTIFWAQWTARRLNKNCYLDIQRLQAWEAHQ